jgi:hypothetical protein
MQPPASLDELKEEIELFLLEQARPLLSEPGHNVIDLSASSYELSFQHGKLLWHIWNENTNVVRQITGIAISKPNRLVLRYQPFGRGSESTLALTDSRATSAQLDRRGRRTQYARTLRRWLHQLCPQWKVQELSTEPDLGRSFSGRYVRAWITRGRQAWAVIGSGESESNSRSDDMIAYGLLWLDWLRNRHPSHVVEGLKMFLPHHAGELTRNRMAWLSPGAAKWELYETGFGTGDEIRQCDPADFGNLKTSLTSLIDLNRPSTAVQELVEAATASSPGLEVRQGHGGYRHWSVHGLMIARERPHGTVFGLGRTETPLRQENVKEFEALVRRVSTIRRADSPNASHPINRIQPERWMESLIRRRLEQLEPDLTTGVVYEQAPAISGTARGVLDLLTVNASGRLVVLELKASEDIQLPLQALDYWMRVHWHNQRGELKREGYFPARELSRQPPLLLLVSPALQFHSACEVIQRYLSPEVEVVRIGLNQDWRTSLQVVSRQATPPHHCGGTA